MAYRGYKDLRVYQLSFEIAMEVFRESRHFPSSEKYGLTSQILDSSRSVAANLAEGWKKRMYAKAFVSKLVECAGEASETQVWLEFACRCGYFSEETRDRLSEKCDEVCKMLDSMIRQPEKFSG